jgi:hypothetical protein
MKQLTNTESEFLSAWCEKKKKLSAQDKDARQTKNQLKAMEKQLRKIVPRADETVSNGEWEVRYKNIPVVEYTVPKKTRLLWTIKPQGSE